MVWFIEWEFRFTGQKSTHSKGVASKSKTHKRPKNKNTKTSPLNIAKITNACQHPGVLPQACFTKVDIQCGGVISGNNWDGEKQKLSTMTRFRCCLLAI